MQTHTTSSGRRDDGADRATATPRRALEALDLLDEAWASLNVAGRTVAVAAIVAALSCALVATVPVPTAVALAAAVPAVLVDVHAHRLPDALVRLAALTGLVAVIVGAMAGGTVPVVGIALGAVVMSGPMFVLHLASPRSMGFGDVKLGLVLGGALGAIHWQLALSGLALAAGLTAVFALVRRRDTVAFGPGLFVGALLAVACHGALLPASGTGVEHTNVGADDAIAGAATVATAREARVGG